MERINFSNYEKINKLIKNYNQAKLMIVSKGRSINQINQFIEVGHNYYGENRVQEAHSKFILPNIINLELIHLSLIGPLQTNKVKLALEIFDSIQTIDRIKIIDEISKNFETATPIKTKEFFIQVNIGREKQKHGVAPEEIFNIFEYAKKKKIPIKGLMCIPPANTNPVPYFNQMLEIKRSIDDTWLLSMGMSNDYQSALENKTNIIRVGSLLFE